MAYLTRPWRSRHFFCGAACVVVCCLSQPSAAATLESAGLSVEVRDGSLVALTNRLTGESVLTADRTPRAAAGLHRLPERLLSLSDAQHTADTHQQGVNRDQAVWRKASGELRGRLQTQFQIEDATGDLLVTQHGTTEEPGLCGVSWELDAIPDRLQILVPGNSGQAFGADSPRGRREFDYPSGWESPFVLVQGAQGGLLVRAEDAQYRFTHLEVDHSRRRFRLRFESRAFAPFDSVRTLTSSHWRITPYRGDWREGTRRYRGWLQARYAPVPLAQQTPAWVRDIQFVVIMNHDAGLLPELAKHCRPAQTLLYVPSWRKDAYDRNYPDYEASATFGPFVTEAHRLGFRVMPHVNYFGCDPQHPLYERFRPWQVRDPFTKELQWWDWDKADPPIRFAYINPASRAWRELFIGRMVEIQRRFSVDALHLDQTLCIYNDANGAIDGRNMIEGSVALHRELREALPDVALSGEGLNEVTCRFEAFAQRHVWGIDHTAGTWDERSIALAHPVSSAVFAPFTQPYGYLGLPNPESIGLFQAWCRAYERFGVLPTYAWPSRPQLQSPSSPVRAVMEQAAFFQQYRPTADFDAAWTPADLFVYRLADGGQAAFRREHGSVLLHQPADGSRRVLARRIEGVTQAEVSGSIPGWLAYDDRRLLGLEPARVYPWSPEPRDLAALHLAALPAGFAVVQAGRSPEFLRCRIETSSAGRPEIRLWEFADAVRSGVQLPDGETRTFPDLDFDDEPSGGTLYIDHQGLFVHPPWKNLPRGQSRAVAFVEFPLRLPDLPQVRFETGVHLRAGAEGKSDGVTFRVTAAAGEQKLAADTHYGGQAPRELTLDLSEFRGQSVRLRLEADPGPAASPSFDWGRFDRPRVTGCSAAATTLETIRVAGQTPAAKVLVASGAASVQSQPDGTLAVQLPLPNTLIVTQSEPAAIVIPGDLAQARFTSRVVFADGIERPAYSFFGGGFGDAVCGGEKRRALQFHPPQSGKSLADFWIKLPAHPAILRTAIGIRDGSKSTGVGFSIEVNGRTMFQRSLRPGGGWTPVTVDLSPWQGDAILLTLSTDAQGDFSFDWAVWDVPQLTGKTP